MRRVAGIDVGGTFTGLLLYEAGPKDSRERLAKILTTAANQTDGVLAAAASS
jgi:N-methylhydantoinase A